jgi:hypothetical protein
MNAIQSFENSIWHNRALNRAVRSTYVSWSQSYPTGESALLDGAFVQGELMPFLSRFVDGEPGIGTTELVRAWAAHLRIPEQSRAQWCMELAPAVRDFLRIFDGEFDYQRSRRQRSLWYKLWHPVPSTAGHSSPVVAAG